MTSEDSIIKYFYPKQFTINLNGEELLWRGIIILDFPDEELLIKAYNSATYNVEWTESEKLRNRHCKERLFVNFDDIGSQLEDYLDHDEFEIRPGVDDIKNNEIINNDLTDEKKETKTEETISAPNLISIDIQNKSERSISESTLDENIIISNKPIEIIPDKNNGRAINIVDHGISGDIFPLEIESVIPLDNVSCFELSLPYVPKENLYAGKISEAQFSTSIKRETASTSWAVYQRTRFRNTNRGRK